MITLSKSDKNFYKLKSYIVNNIKNLCQSQISNTYIKNTSLTNVDYIIYLGEDTTKTRSKELMLDNLKGFTLAEDKKDHLYVDVICSKGYGKELLDEVYKLGKKLKKSYIKLNALPHVINYYKKQGFFITSLKEIDLKKFTNSNNAIKNEQFKKFLKFLIKLNTKTYNRCKTVRRCSENGFTMIKNII